MNSKVSENDSASKETDEEFDVIIIGSGMGALSCGSLLAQLANKRVLILERHFKAGGYTHTFERQGFRWDVGVHYIGRMAPHEDSRQLFDLITQKKLDWARLPDKFDTFHYPDFDFSVHADPVVYKTDLLERFPAETAALHQYFRDIKLVNEWFRQQLIQSLMPSTIRWAMQQRDRAVRALANQTTRDYLDKQFKSTELKALLASQWGDCGLPPSKSPFSLHSIIVCHYFGGAYYPIGSAKSIADSTLPVIKAHGGDCRLNHTVKNIIIEDGVAKGVEVSIQQGKNVVEKQYFAPVVISDAGRAITFGELVPEAFQQQIPAKVADDICSMVTLYLGLKADPSSMGFDGENHWIFESYDHDNMFANTMAQDGGKSGGCFLSFPSLKDPAATTHTAEVIGFMKLSDLSKWSETRWKHRGDEYQALKERISDTLLAVVENKFPGFSDLIAYRELSTPLTVRDFTGHHNAAIYGYPSTTEEFNKRDFNPKTSIKNLYMTGADVVSLGIMGALTGGVMTASHLMGGLPGFFKIMASARELAKSKHEKADAVVAGAAGRAQ